MSHVHLTSFPEYKQAAKILADKGAEVRLAMVNAMEEMELAKRFEIRGFPTLKYFKHGVIPRDYQGHRKAEASRAAPEGDSTVVLSLTFKFSLTFFRKSEPHCGMNRSQSWLILSFCSLLFLKSEPKMSLDLSLILCSVSV